MKLYYYSFYKNGEITEEMLIARKNKDSYVVTDGVYGGINHEGKFKYWMSSENKMQNCFSETAYLFSSKKINVDDNLKQYALLRAKKYNDIVKATNDVIITFVD